MTLACAFVLPGDLNARTGGYRYDRRIVEGLRGRGARVDVHALDPCFPTPSSAALDAAERVFAAQPDGALAVVDGLAFGAMPAIAARHGARLRLVALVHHPLARERGLPAARARTLAQDERRALAHATHVIATSTVTADTLTAEYDVGPARISVVEPGTDGAPLAHGAAPHAARDGPLRLLCVATLTPRKGHDVLLDALAPLRGGAWQLDCYGSDTRDAAAAAHVRGRIAALGLGAQVRLHGEVDDATLGDAYVQADVCVLPSWYEGYGMAIAEAIAYGLPVVTTTGGALARTVPVDAAVQVPPGDVEALSTALRRVSEDTALRTRLAQGAMAARMRLRNWSQACAEFDAVLRRVSARALA